MTAARPLQWWRMRRAVRENARLRKLLGRLLDGSVGAALIDRLLLTSGQISPTEARRRESEPTWTAADIYEPDTDNGRRIVAARNGGA